LRASGNGIPVSVLLKKVARKYANLGRLVKSVGTVTRKVVVLRRNRPTLDGRDAFVLKRATTLAPKVC
jgi:hypothetical protein